MYTKNLVARPGNNPSLPQHNTKSQRSMVQNVHGGSRRGTAKRPVHVGSGTDGDELYEQVIAAATLYATIAAAASLG